MEITLISWEPRKACFFQIVVVHCAVLLSSLPPSSVLIVHFKICNTV